jgi:hypothetical protein
MLSDFGHIHPELPSTFDPKADTSSTRLDAKQHSFTSGLVPKSLDKEFINIAQIVTEQIVFATLGTFRNPRCSAPN